MNKNQISASKIKSHGKIVATDVSNKKNDLIKFSFQFLDLNNPDFCINNQDTKYFLTKLKRFRDVSTIKVFDFRNTCSQTLRNHRVDWKKDTGLTRKGFGIPNSNQLDDTAFQFSLSANEYGRVIGSIIDDVFYVIWFDPMHNCYKKKKKK